MPIRLLMGFIVLLLFFLFTWGCATKRCGLSFEQSPEVRGFKLGQKHGDLFGRFSGLPDFQPDENGLNWFVIQPRQIALNAGRAADRVAYVNASLYPELSDVQYVKLEYVDEVLQRFTVRYKNDLKWASAEGFIDQIKKTLNIPDGWEKVGSNSRHQGTYCDRFSIHAGIKDDYPISKEEMPFVEVSNYVEIIQPDLRRYQKEDKQKAEEEKKRQEFKP